MQNTRGPKSHIETLHLNIWTIYQLSLLSQPQNLARHARVRTGEHHVQLDAASYQKYHVRPALLRSILLHRDLESTRSSLQQSKSGP